MALVYRLVKGSPLTNAEGDGNITDLDGRVTNLEDNPAEPRGIESIEQTGNQITFIMTDSSEEGPFTIEAVGFNPRGDWEATTLYAVDDFFYAPDGRTYLVAFGHTSESEFDAAANDGMGNDFYQLLFDVPALALPTGGSTGFNLAKASTSDYDWVFLDNGVPTGGTDRQVLLKVGTDDYDKEWGELTLDDLSDVTADDSDLAAGDLIQYDGADWVRTALADLGLLYSDIGGTATVLGTSGTVSLDPTLGDVFTVTPSNNITLNAASAPVGVKITVIVTTSGTSSYNITPTTNFKSTGALATGTASGKVFTLSFVGDGTNLNETGRTTAM